MASKNMCWGSPATLLPYDIELEKRFFRKENIAPLEEVIQCRQKLQYDSLESQECPSGKYGIRGRDEERIGASSVRGFVILYSAMHNYLMPSIQALLQLSESISTPCLLFDHPVEFDPAGCSASYFFSTQSVYFRPAAIGDDALNKKHELVLGHELSHHALNVVVGLHRDTKSFAEGHALGVETLLNSVQGDGNSIYSYSQYEKRTRILSKALQMLKPGARPRRSFQRLLRRSSRNRTSVMRDGHDKHYVVGFSLFAIKELEHGPSIYAESLRDPGLLLR